MAGQISAGKIRAILESAHGFRPDDRSPEAARARMIDDFGDVDGLRFVGKVGVQKAQGDYPPDRTAWHPITQVNKAARPQAQSAAPAPAAAITKPAWAE